MARPVKTGLDYFPLDTEWDVKMKLVKARFGLIGVGCIIELYKLIYHEGYAIKWDEDTQLLFSADNNIDVNTLQEIVVFSTEKGVFSTENLVSRGVLTSRGIQKRWLRVAKESGRSVKKIDDEINLLDETRLSVPETRLSVPETRLSVPEIPQSKAKQSKVKKRQTAESSMRDAETADDGFGEDSGESAMPPAAASYMIQGVWNSQDRGGTAMLRDALASSGMSSSFSSREIEAVAEYLATHGLDFGFVTWAIGKAREPSVRNPGGFLKSALTGRGDFADFPERYREERYREESRPQQQEQQRSRAPSTCPKCGKKLKATSDRAACKACGLMLEYDESLDDWAEADEGLVAGADKVLAAMGVRR